MSLLWPDCISPDIDIPDAERRKIRMEATAQFQAGRGGWKISSIIVGASALGPFVIIPLNLGYLLQTLAMIVWFTLALMVCVIVRRRLIVRSFRVAARRQGYNICVNCGYWLRGLDESHLRCPECGHVSETVGSTDSAEDPPP